MPDQTSGPYGEYELPGHPPPPGRVPTWPLSAEDEAAVIDAMNSAPRPLAVRCRACLAPRGEPCIGTTSDLPREQVHRLRPLAAAPRLVHCPDCEGSGWRETGRRMLAPQVTCPVCGAGPTAQCTEGGAERRHLHVVRRRAARAGLEPCPSCDAVGWVPDEPAAPRPEVPDSALRPMTDQDTAMTIAHMNPSVSVAQAELVIELLRRNGWASPAAVPVIEQQARDRAVATARAAILKGIREYFSPVDDEMWEAARIVCGRIERGEYGARKETTSPPHNPPEG